MKDVEIIGMLKSYINATLIGMGALKGAACQVKSNTYDPETGINTLILKWKDNEGDDHETTILIHDGAKGDTGATGSQGPEGPEGPAGEDGADGFSPTITVKTSTDTTYILTITTSEGSFDTPNLKGGGGGGGASSLNDLSDVRIVDVQSGQLLRYNASSHEWENFTLSAFTGATSQAAGSAGLVPAPTTSDPEKLLKGDGTWTDEIITEAQWTSIQSLLV